MTGEGAGETSGVTMSGTLDQRAKLFAKMARVLAGTHRVPKTGRNEFHKYDYATEADLLDAIRPAMAEQGIALFYSIIGVERVAIPDSRSGPLTRVQVAATFCCGETGASVTVQWWGEGQDAGDKGLYKALTGATKYLLMKTFLVSTGDDPEGDEDAPPRASAPQRPAPPAAQPARAPGAPGKPADPVGHRAKLENRWAELWQEAVKLGLQPTPLKHPYSDAELDQHGRNLAEMVRKAKGGA